MKTTAYYLDYMADEYGVDGHNALTSKVLRQFKKYLVDTIEDWELQGDIDYLKQLGMYKTKGPVSGTITANRGEQTVTLSSDPGFKAIGCELQVAGKIYTLVQYLGSSQFNIFPAFMDADTTTEVFEIRFNRFPAPPYFKKLLKRNMIYLTSLDQRHEIQEIDFSRLPLSNDDSDPVFCQVRYTTRTHGFITQGIVSGSVITVGVTATAMTDDMVNMPVMFEGRNEIYHIVNVNSTGKTITLDREISSALTASTNIFVLPKGSYLFELYPHPDEEKQIIYDYLESEASKSGDTEIIQAPSTVVLAGLNIRLARFKKSASTSEIESLKDSFTTAKEDAKAKEITDYVPSVAFFGSGRENYYSTDYGRKRYPRRRGPYGRP